jgi:MFS family permease
MGRYLSLVTIGGCLAMLYVSCVNSPYTTDFFRDLGATEFQFGLLTGLPLVALSLQFAGAYLQITRTVERRKPFFMIMLMGCRLLYLPIALLPLIFPAIPAALWVLPFVWLVTISGGMNYLATPMWMSWMADLIPSRVVNRYWAERQRHMQLVWTAAYLAVGAFALHGAHVPVRYAFACLTVIGVVAGVVDIALFAWVKEPEPARVETAGLLGLLVEPLRDPNYKRIILFSTAFSFATMFGAAFMLLYVLKVLHIPVWQANLIWCLIGVGGATVCRTWGRLADRHGQRPVMITIILAKPWVALAFMLVTPESAFLALSIVMFFDSMANTGYVIAMNGFMMKTAPRETRAVFVAATHAINGIAGGLGAILGGVYLDWASGASFHFAGRTWGNYHLVFFLSFCMRLICIPLVIRIREPRSSPTEQVWGELMDLWPPRLLAYPYTLYRRIAAGNGAKADEPAKDTRSPGSEEGPKP